MMNGPTKDEVAALDAAPQAAAVKPLAWRWKPKSSTVWFYDPDPEWLSRQSLDEIDAEPVYSAPSPLSAAAAYERAAAERALKDALTYIDKGHHGMARNIIAVAIARLKGSQP